MILRLDDEVELDTSVFELRRHGAPVPLEPQAFDVLAYLVAHRDRVVAKEELMDAVWGGRFVSETAVTSRIKQVRRALGDDGQAQRLVRTQHGRGYRFVGTVAGDAGEAERVTGAGAPVRYTVSDGLHIAYQVTGTGERDIVLISGFASHLELDWADSRHAHFLDRLGRNGRLIRFDKRGTGMSDRPSGVPDLETRMHDVLAVLDEVGSRRAVLCGYSEGGPMAILFAAAHPERVSSLVLYSCYAKRTRGEDNPWAQTDADNAAYAEFLVRSWDWEADLRRRCPSGDVAMQRWWAQRMRASATPSTIRALMQMNALVDVRGVLGAVRVPTLVMHRKDDRIFDVREAHYLAERIPGARLVVLDGADHLVCGDPDQLLDTIEPFLAEVASPAEPELALAAVVAVQGPKADDVVGGLVAAGGRRRTAYDGSTVVLFDGPATAVRAGLQLLGPGARAGLGVAEVPRDAETVDAPGVRAALELARAATDGDLCVSDTVAVLLSSSTVTLEPARAGVPGQRVRR